MTVIKELLLNAGGTVTAGAVIVGILSLLQVSKIQINPWDALRRWIGAKFGAEQVTEIAALKGEVKELRERLDEYIRINDQRTADEWRRKILTFENQLLRGISHTKEHFTEIYAVIGDYEEYCNAHPDYKNHLIVNAIGHIDRAYQDCQNTHGFLKED